MKGEGLGIAGTLTSKARVGVPPVALSRRTEEPEPLETILLGVHKSEKRKEY